MGRDAITVACPGHREMGEERACPRGPEVLVAERPCESMS